MDAMLALDAATNALSLDQRLRLLIQLRVSQLNGCAYCLALHTVEARAAGVDESALATLAAWRESPFFSAAERAALELAEAVTTPEHGVDDEIWTAAVGEHGEDGTLAIFWTTTVMNAWNRVAVTLRMQAPTVR